jgi:hypothetical protein
VIWFAPFQGLGDDELLAPYPSPKAPPRPRDDTPAREPQPEGTQERKPARGTVTLRARVLPPG